MCNLDSIMLDYSDVLLSSAEETLLVRIDEPPSHEYKFPFTAVQKICIKKIDEIRGLTIEEKRLN